MDTVEYPESQLPGPSSTSPSKEPKRNYRKLALILGILFVGGFCLFSIIVSGLMTVIITASDSQEDWLSLSDTYMQAMARNEVDSAYALFSEQAKSDFGQSDLSRLTKGSFYALFDGYESLELESWEINYNFPAGKFAELIYRIRYLNEYEGSLYAVLEEEGDGWKLYWIEVTVPPEKLDEYVGIETRE